MEIVHIDLNSPTKTKVFYVERYFMILVDEFSRMMWVAFIKGKFEAFDKLRYSRIELRMNMVLK